MAATSSTTLPGLSLIRTIAAFSVLFGHMYQFGSWGVSEAQQVWLPEVYLPVTTFFVITGFLITWGLLHEWDRTGDISLANGYKRRAIRILPMYYIGIGIGFLALWLLGDKLNGNPALLFCLLPNISHALGTTPFPFWHYWFMGTEILFYLLFPLLFKYGRKHLLPIVATIGITWMLLKWGSYAVIGKTFLYRFLGVTQFDTILLGALAAIVYKEHREQLAAICGKCWFAIVAWLLFLSTQLWAPSVPSPIRAEVIAVISVMLVLSAFCGHPIGENRLTQYLSKMSYGIYIFHPIVIYFLSSLCIRHQITYECAWGGVYGGLRSDYT